LFCAPLLAAPLIAQGSASLDAGVPAAREMAIQDAMHQAALSNGAQVESAQYMNSGAVSESTSLSAAPLSGKVTVLEEGVQDGLYQVRIKLEPREGHEAAAGCLMPGGRNLRRRVVTSYFNVDHPADASDLSALGVKLPHELAMRLARYGNVIGARDAGNIGVLPAPGLTDPALAANNVRRLAQDDDGQFVVSGRVSSSAVVKRGVQFSAFASSLGSQQAAAYDGPLSGFTGGALQYRPSAREFEIELWIYDGLTGALLSNQRLSTQAQGDVSPDQAPAFASGAFWATPYGAAIDHLLDQAVSQIASTLSCLPYTARVLRVGAGGQVYLDAGGVDGLQVGDKLLIYRPQINQEVQSSSSGSVYGVPETLLGDLSVIQVQPQLSIAVAQSVRGKVESGDWVRFIPKR
jgi:hypothetical protein